MAARKRLLGLIALSSLLILNGCGSAESRRAHYVEKSEQYYKDHNYEKARIELRNALQIDPKDAEARVWAGRVAEKLNNPREALGHYQAAVEQDAKNDTARAALARLYLLGGYADKAVELVELGLRSAPQSAQLLVVRGAARARLGDMKGALKDAEDAARQTPNDEFAIALLASLYRQSQREDRAAAVVAKGLQNLPDSIDLHIIMADLQRSMGHPGEAEAQLKKIIELEPKIPSHRYRLAQFYLMNRDVAAAEAALRGALNLAPEAPDSKIILLEFLAQHRNAMTAESQAEVFLRQRPDDDSLKLAIGGYFEKASKPERAQQIYQSVVQHSGKKADGLRARDRLAVFALRKNNVTEAQRLVAEVLAENARDNDALILRGNIKLSAGDALTAITDFRAVLRDQPEAVGVMRSLARAHLQNKEPAMAEEVLRSAAKINPADQQSRLDLAQLLAQQGKLDLAKPVLEELTGEKTPMLAAFDPLFRLQLQQKDYPAARITAEKLQAVRPDLAAGFYYAALVDEAEHKQPTAVANYERAIAVQPQAAEPLTALVRLDLANKQGEKAVARIDHVLEKFPNAVAALNLKGEALTAQRNFSAARDAFNAAINRQQQWWIPYRGLAATFLAQNDMKGATEVLERGVKQTKSTPALVIDLASVYERTGQSDQAIKLYEDVLQREPDSEVAANNLAMLLVTYRQDNASLERAKALTQQLAKVDEPAILNTRGWVSYKSGAYREALPLLQQAVDKVPNSPVMHYHLGMAQYKNGDRDAARKNLEFSLQTSQKFVGDADARATLEQINKAG